jgi:hypothetical protein
MVAAKSTYGPSKFKDAPSAPDRLAPPGQKTFQDLRGDISRASETAWEEWAQVRHDHFGGPRTGTISYAQVPAGLVPVDAVAINRFEFK